ncbi:hypothetical protein ACROYT_G013921 [Oculina patagonica]
MYERKAIVTRRHINHSSVLFVARDNRDNTFSVEDIIAFARGLDEKYAEQKESIRRLQFSGHVGLPADEMAMALLPKELPLQPEERLVAVKTTGNGDCLYNAVSLVMDGIELSEVMDDVDWTQRHTALYYLQLAKTGKIFRAPWRIRPQKVPTPHPKARIFLHSFLPFGVYQVHELALDNKAIEDQLVKQQNTDITGNRNDISTSQTSKDTSVCVPHNLVAAIHKRSRTKLIEAITRSQFIHFIELLRLKLDLHASKGQQVIITPQGQLLTKRARPQRNISLFDSWLATWFQFKKILVDAHLNRYSELCVYREVIHAASRKFRWSSVYSYDVSFRTKLASEEITRFDQLDQTL